MLYLQGRQAVVVCQLLRLLVTQVLNSQAEAQFLQRHRRHVVGHVINLRVQGERWKELKTTQLQRLKHNTTFPLRSSDTYDLDLMKGQI